MKKLLLLLVALVAFGSMFAVALNEGFENTAFPPAEWSVFNGGGANTWVRSTNGYHSGSASARITYNSTAHDDWLITPRLSPSATNYTLSFWAYSGSSTYLEEFDVKLSTATTATADFTVSLASAVTAPNTWTQFSYDLSAYIGQNIYIAVRAISTDELYLYLDDFVGPEIYAAPLPPNPTTLVSPLDLGTNILQTATLNWNTATGNPTGYKLYFGTDGAGLARPTNIVNGTNLGNVLTYDPTPDLAYSTTYYWQIVPTNTTYGDATVTEIWEFTTGPNPTISSFDPAYVEGFESVTTPALPYGWSVIDNNADGDKWVSSTTYPRTGTNCARIYTDGNTVNDDYLVTPPLALTGNQELKFWVRAYSTSEPDEVSVLLSSTSPTAAAFTTVLMPSTAVNYTTYTEYTINLSAYSGTVYIAFTRRNAPENGWYLHLDDVMIRDIPAVAAFSINPTAWDFLAVDVTVPANKVFTITNTGGGTLGLTSVGITTGTPYYTISTPPATMSLGAGLSTTFTVTFDPEAAIAYEGVITIVHSLGSTTVDLDGTGIVRPAGSTVGNPYPVTLPLVGFTGDTSLYGDDYESGWVTPSNSYIGGDDMVLQFTLAVPSTVSGTLASTDGGTWVGMVLVNTAPDPTTPAPVLGSGTSSGSTATMAGVNLAAGTYYLIISTWPTPQSFAFTLDLNAVVLTAPGPATPTAPVNNAVGVSLLPTFTWTAPTTGSAPTGYKVFCDTNTAPNTLIGTVTGLNYTAINSLVYNTLYYWKVVAYNSVGDAIGNTVWSFTTQVDPTNPPTAPILLSPDGTALMPVEGFNFTWAVNGTGGNPSGYKLYVSREGGAGFFDAAFSYDLEATVTSYDPTEAGVDPMTYTYSTHYWWTVRADDAEGPYQAPIEFVIEDDPTEAVPYQQDFESASTLASINWSGNMLVGAPHGVNASKGAYFNLFDSEGWWTCSAITPPVGPMPANPTPSQLKFDYRIVNWSGYPATATALGTLDNVQIQVSTDGGANYTTIHTINQANHVTSNLFAPVTLDLSAYASQIIMIQFLGTWGAGDYYLDIDNVFVRESPTLPIFSVTPTVGIYGEVELNVASPVTFVVSNLGVGSLDINSIGIAGPDQASFVLLNPPTYPVHITDTPVSFVVQFTPTTLGEKTATLTFTDALTRTTHEIPLSGTGINEAMITGLNLSGSVISNVNVQLNWVPVTTDGFGTWVHYDDGANSSGVGYNAPATFAVAIKYSTATLTPYIGQNLTSVKFFPYVADALYTVKVWKGTDDAMAPSTLLYSSPVPYFTGNAWNEHPINPILINGTDAIYIGYEVTTTWGYPAGADAGPALVGYGDLLYTTTGEWVSMMTAYSIDRNWNLQGYVTPGPTAISGNLLNIPVVSNTTKSSSMRNAQIPSVDPRLSSTSSDRFITGYKVYRNTVLITPTPVQGFAYLDSDLTDGNYEYYVVAQYANGTVTSNTYSTPITGLPPIDLPFLEDWSSSSLDTNNWIAGSTNWLIETSQGNATPSVKFSWTPQVLDYDITLTSFRFDGTDLANIKLKFDIALNNYSTDAENLMSWDVFDGTTWHTMGTISSLVDDFGWTTYASDITAFAAGHDFKVRFRAHGEDSYEINYWYIDNIHLELMPTTLTVPANVEISVSGTDLTLAWDAVAGADWYAIYVSQDPYADPYVYAGWLNANGITLPAATFGNPGFLKITAGAGAEPGRGIRLDTPEPPNFPPTKK